MQYISPISLLETLNTQQFDKKGLALARKKLLAELELNGGKTLVQNGRELTKNDIINFFEALPQVNNLPFHIAVADDAVLLSFLQNNVLGDWKKFKRSPLYNDAQFIEWISPYFFNSFHIVSGECFAEQKANEWATLLINPMLMNAYYTGKAWEEIEKTVNYDLELLQDFQQNGGAAGRYLGHTLSDFRYISMLKRLPDDRFMRLKDEYAYAIMQCAGYIYKINASTGTIMVENALLLVVSEEVREQIMGKYAELLGLNHKADKKRNRGINVVVISFFIIYVFMVGKFASCGAESHNNPIYFNAPPNQPVRTPAQLDSFKNKFEHLKAGDSINSTEFLPPETTDTLPAEKGN